MIYLEDYYSMHHCINCNSELKVTKSVYNETYKEGKCEACSSYSISWVDDEDGILINSIYVKYSKLQEAVICHTSTTFYNYEDKSQEYVRIYEIMQVNANNFKHQLDRARKLKAFE